MYQHPNQRDFARHLRKNLTDAERRLWHDLRCEQLQGFKFRRQAAIGNYVVDFVCFSNKLIVELDGGQHNEEHAKQLRQRENNISRATRLPRAEILESSRV